MSGRPGLTLEDFLAWHYCITVDGDGSSNVSLQLAEALGSVPRRPDITHVDFQQLCDLFEPYRDGVERSLVDFDEESQSWRDYSDNVFAQVPDNVFTVGGVLLRAAGA